MLQHKHPKADGERAMAGMTLRMADGGFFSKLKPNFMKSGTERFNEAQAKEKAAAAVPAAPAQAAAPVQSLRDYSAGTALDKRMKAAGLKDGGEVPGKGKGDKVPALYEPGEFVVSNDMLDDAPGLRDQLHEMREGTLAKRGKTVAEADEAAMGGESLRAALGFGDAPLEPEGGNRFIKYAPQGFARGPEPLGGGPLNDMPKLREFGRSVVDAVTPSSETTSQIGNAVKDFFINPNSPKLRPTPGGLNDFDGIKQAVGLGGAGAGRGSVNPAFVDPNAATTAPTQPTGGPSIDTSTRSLRQGAPGTDEAGVVYRNGNSFSGRDVSGYGNQSVVPAMDQRLIDETLTNPDGSRWSGADNATMAANLRDGVDPYRGTSRAPKEQSQIERLALSEAGTPGRRAAMKILSDREQNATTLRGQDITASGQAQTARNAAASAAALKAQQDRQYELDVAKFGVESANKKRDDKRAGDAAFDTRIKGLVGDDADGTKAAGIRNAANAFLANKQAEMEAALKADPNNKRAAAILKDIQENGVSGMDEDTLRNLTLGTKANQLAQENDSAWWNPFGGTAKNTSTPVTSLRQQKNMIFPDQDITDNGQIIPSRVVEENPDLLRLRR